MLCTLLYRLTHKRLYLSLQTLCVSVTTILKQQKIMYTPSHTGFVVRSYMYCIQLRINVSSKLPILPVVNMNTLHLSCGYARNVKCMKTKQKNKEIT